MNISKNKKMRFFIMSQGSFNPKNRFLGQNVCSVARVQTHRQTGTKVNTEDRVSGFFLQPIIKDRSNIGKRLHAYPTLTGPLAHLLRHAVGPGG